MSDAKPEVFRKDGFGKKLGPLPIWAWALILAAGVYLFYKFYSGNSSSSAGSPTLGDATAYPSYSDLGDATGSGAYYTGNYGDSSGSSGSAFTDNQSWLNAALGEASSFGVNATDLNAALTDWLNGSTITQQQSNWINEVVGALGAPPTGTTGVSTVTPNPDTSAPTELTNGMTADQLKAAGLNQYGIEEYNLFETLLGRAPNTGAGSVAATNNGTYAKQLAAGMSTAQVAKEIQSSAEYKNKNKKK